VDDFLGERDTWTSEGCSIAGALDLVGARSTLLLLREASLGTTRFGDFVSRVGLSEPMAARRLKDLVGEGLLERRSYREPGSRAREEYRLTVKGQALVPVLMALRQWGDEYASPEAGPTLRMAHADCGAELRVEVRCAAGHRVGRGEVEVTPGPGLVRR
jgi:DNA-binding HxlR family transcriptional regulator